jgi:hypothetical protein
VPAAVTDAIEPGLGDPLVQDLAGLGLLVRQQQLAVDRVVRLAVRAVDLGRREDRVEAERARLVRDDRHEPVPICLSFMRSLSRRTTAIVVATACLPDPRRSPSYAFSPGSSSGFARPPARSGT